MIYRAIETIESKLNTVIKQSGQLIYCTDTKNIYYDATTGERIAFTDIVSIATEEEKDNLLAPVIDKIYFTVDTKRLYIYDYTNEIWEEISKYNLPIATSLILGGVKSSEDSNKIKVETDGTMTVNSADRLSTPRNISIYGSIVGSTTFDGTQDGILTVIRRGCTVGQSDNITTNIWFKFASIIDPYVNNDNEIIFLVSSTYQSTNKAGILKAHLRTNFEGKYESSQLYWLSNNGIDPSDFVMVYNSDTNPTVAECWCKITSDWQYYNFEVIGESTRAIRHAFNWVLYDYSPSEDNTTDGYETLVSSLLPSATRLTRSDFAITATSQGQTVFTITDAPNEYLSSNDKVSYDIHVGSMWIDPTRYSFSSKTSLSLTEGVDDGGTVFVTCWYYSN